jgi:hypothetical protein
VTLAVFDERVSCERRECRLEVVEQDPETLVLSPIRLCSPMARAGSPVEFRAAVRPSGFAPLMEWRVEGTPSGSPAGEDELPIPGHTRLLHPFVHPGTYRVSLGPPGAPTTTWVEVENAAGPAAGPGPVFRESPRRALFPNQFEEVSLFAGIDGVGQTFGSSWGDANGDGRPDLWVSNHARTPSLYYSLPGNTFVDVTPYFVVGTLNKDSHGAAWADFDADGDLDLLEMVGGGGGFGSDPNSLYLNQGFNLLDVAVLAGLDNPLGRGRTPLWLDWDDDQDLDVVLANFQRNDGLAPSELFLRVPEGFVGVGDLVPLGGTGHHRFSQLGDLDADGRVELVHHGFPYPSCIFELDQANPQDRTAELGLPRTQNVRDAALADFDGDLLPDVFLATRITGPGMALPRPDVLEAKLIASGDEVGFDLDTVGPILLTVDPAYSIEVDEIYLGPTAFNPPDYEFELDPLDLGLRGAPAYVAGVDSGLYLWFDDVEHVWRARHSSPVWRSVNVVVVSGVEITEAVAVGFDPAAPQPDNRLFLQRAGSFEDVTVASGLAGSYGAISVVAADFDCDMDLDLYCVLTAPTENLPNVLFENLGAGSFRAVPGAGGAAASLLGRGESVTVADYDVDGFPDLFVANGLEDPPFALDGPHQLFHNTGNDNHWLELDLRGVASNIEGIGARVVVTAGGVDQLREQGGGMHSFAQNHSRLHFGLGPNEVADSVVIEWPSGTLQVLTNVTADQVLLVVEE